MLRVRCDESELQEYGESIAVGQDVARPGLRRAGGRFFGAALDDVEWAFDRYHFLVGTPSVTISGRVVAIEAVFARVARQPDGGWGPLPGSAWTEPVTATSATRRVERRIVWQERSPSGGRWGTWSPEEGDEQGYGWLLTLDPASTEPLAQAV